MVIHLDTTFLVDTMRESRRRTDGPARRWLVQHRTAALAVSLFVLGELLVGAELHAEPDKERQRVRQVIGSLPVALPDERLSGTYARLHADLTRQGQSLATMDLLIASTALNEDAPLLTANGRHFTRVPNLQVLTY
jgi:tRNA(fMet)-specific endonuclease VapC